MTPRFLIIMICYHNENEVISFIHQELGSQTLQDYRCVVVDNSSRQSETLEIIQHDARNMIIYPGNNTGYFGGAALGWEKYKETYPEEEIPFVIVCNTDLHFSDKRFLESLFDQYSGGGFDVFGPDIVSELTGIHQNPYLLNRISKRKLYFFMNITRNSFLYNAFLLLYYPFKRSGSKRTPSKGHSYSLHGSFMVFSRNYFQKGGHFNYGSFLFGEEIFIGELTQQLKMKVLFDPVYQVIHKEHATTGIFKSRSHVKYLHESYKYIIDKYYQ